MNKQLIVAILVLLAVLSMDYYLNFINTAEIPQGVACTMEAKLCPDGSAVGRQGPNCEFAKCPDVLPTPIDTTETDGTLTGTVTLSPTCPVERIPPDPQCAPKPYVAFVAIIPKGRTSSLYQTLETSADGKFATVLPSGRYELQVSNNNNSIYPRCEVVTVVVEGGKTTNSDISCDTGIR